jgi:hypothetical protein
LKHSSKTRSQKIRGWLWPASWWRRFGVIIIGLILGFTLLSYGVGRWYINTHSDEPMVLGTTFVSSYAQSFGLEPKETLEAILSDLQIKQVRLVSYWSEIEPTPGKYDFSQLDWQFEMANKYNAKVHLAIGLRQARWPECHEPDWVDINNKADWQPRLNNYMKAVIERYKNNPALDRYELENEFFMTVFGECKDFDRQRLIDEFNMVKAADPAHKVIISRSNNWIGIPIGEPTPDEFGISVYKRVWDSTFTHRYFEYPLPTWFYAALAGWGQIFTGKPMVIHELQAEPWVPNKKSVVETPLPEQFKSMNADRMASRINYGEGTGMRNIDLWGAEWWYWLKVKQNDPSVWNVVRDEVAKTATDNSKLPRQ